MGRLPGGVAVSHIPTAITTEGRCHVWPSVMDAPLCTTGTSTTTPASDGGRDALSALRASESEAAPTAKPSLLHASRRKGSG